ncbi:hypothetical protein EZV62_011132 [Acer yangbiense]|uniref:Transposase MuDR plant domain-containing protein n=1 Tax=Acer yangbiense TaxID=1000413 RepID=A0A5C7I5A0_9ROSI|nr:hypothetical protein EZV62_011132 [Acer yangbiense]
MASNMVAKFDKYWNDVHGVLAMASLLDPRFKLKLPQYFFPLIYEEDKGLDEVKKVRKLCEEIFLEYQVKDGFFSWNSESSDANEKSELDCYLEEKTLPESCESDVLSWWKLNGIKYPIMSEIARDILAIPISTVALESSFSISGRIVHFRMELLPPTEVVKPQSVVQSVPLLIGEINENIESPNEGFVNETSDDEMSNKVSDEDQFVDVKDSDTDTNSERPPTVLVRGRSYTELPSGVIELQQGQLFNDVSHFRQILHDFTIQEGFALNMVKNESRRVTVKCKAEGCTWRVQASPTAVSAKSSKLIEFNVVMSQIKATDLDAYNWNMDTKRLVIYHGGSLVGNCYKGGLTKWVHVPRGLTYDALVKLVQDVTKVDAARYTIELCSLVCTNSGVARPIIENDNKVSCMMDKDKLIPEVYVTIYQKGPTDCVQNDTIVDEDDNILQSNFLQQCNQPTPQLGYGEFLQQLVACGSILISDPIVCTDETIHDQENSQASDIDNSDNGMGAGSASAGPASAGPSGFATFGEGSFGEDGSGEDGSDEHPTPRTWSIPGSERYSLEPNRMDEAISNDGCLYKSKLFRCKKDLKQTVHMYALNENFEL